MENTGNLIVIDEKDKEEARALTQSFVRNDVKSRAYINALGAELCIKYFRDENISNEVTYNIHSIRKFLEEFDISDVMLSNIHVDVRVITDENQIFVPISHFKYNITPDIYIVLKILKDHSGAEFLGYFEPKSINKSNKNDKYYFIEKEDLLSPETLKSFIDGFSGRSSDREVSAEDLEKAEFLMVSMADNNAGESEKKELFSYLKNSAKLRNKFIEFENGEMICYKAANEIGLKEVDTTTDDLSDLNIEDIAGMDDIIATEDMSGAVGLAAGTASAALAANEAIVSASETVADAVVNADIPNISGLSEDFSTLNDEDISLNFETSDLSSTFDTFKDSVSDFNSNSSDDLVFSNDTDSDDEIIFQNNDDDIVFENNDDLEFSNAGSGASTSGTSLPRIETTINTPISEATELVSLDAIKENKLPPENKPSVNFEEAENIMDASGFEEMSKAAMENATTAFTDTSIGAVDLDEININTEMFDKEEVKLPSLDNISDDNLDAPDVENRMNMEDIPLSDSEPVNNMDDDLTSADFAENLSEVLPETGSINELPKNENDLSISDISDISSVEDITDRSEIHENNAVEQGITEDDSAPAPAIFEDISEEAQQGIIDENSASEIVDVAERELFGAPSINEVEDSIPELEPVSSSTVKQSKLSGLAFNFEEQLPSINEENSENPELNLIYNNEGSSADISSDFVDESVEEYNFVQQNSDSNSKLKPVIAAVVVVACAAALFAFIGGKNKNSIASDDTVLQTSPENEELALAPENGNLDAMSGETSSENTGVLSRMDEQAPQADKINKEARQAAVQDMKQSLAQPAPSQKPVNKSNVVSIKKISWSVPDYLSYSDNIKQYLQTAGKSIKLSLSSDLLLTNDYIYSNQVQVSLKMSKDGAIQSSQIVKSSGSTQIDNIVLQNVKNTLNVIKPPAGEVPNPTFKLGLTISL